MEIVFTWENYEKMWHISASSEKEMVISSG